MRKISYLTVSSIALCASLGVTAAKAQDSAAPANTGVDDIIVTAQKRGENVQDVPIAITALSAESLQAKGITDVIELTRSTPNIYAAPFTLSNSILFFFMRGMGVGAPNAITTDPSIGFYENGIYDLRPLPFVFDLYDPERVEILRGPQGTLYGRNTTGGAINIISRAPTGVGEVRQLASYASRDQYRSVTHVDLPALGALKIKGTLTVGGDDGFAKNMNDPLVPDTNDFGMSRHVAGRIAARLDLGEDFTADYSFALGKLTTTQGLVQSKALEGEVLVAGGPPYHYTRDRSYRPVVLPLSHDNIRDHGLTLEWRAADSVTFRSITSIRHLDYDHFADTADVYGFGIAARTQIDSDILSQELQVVGSTWDDRVKYAAGLYYYREKLFQGNLFTFPFGVQNSLVDFKSVSKAAYAQVTITPPILDDRLDLTFGARQTWDRKEANQNQTFNGFPTAVNVGGVLKSDRFNPSATIAYRWTDNINSYAKVATGYRAGGFDEAAVFSDRFNSEKLTSYEIGLKADLFDRHLRTNFAAFYNKFKDIQLPLATDPTNPSVNSTRNAGVANIWGMEADITIAPTDRLTVNVNYAYLGNEIKEVRLTPTSANIADTFVLPYAPKHSVAVSGDLVVLRTDEGPLTLHADYTYKTSVFGSSGAGPAVPGREVYRAPSQSMVNGRITLERDLFGNPAKISVFAKNLLDNRFIAWVSAQGSQASGYLKPNFFLTAPRTIGVEVSFAFGGS